MVGGESGAGGMEARETDSDVPVNFRTESSFSHSSGGALERVRLVSWSSKDILLFTELKLEVDAF